MDLPSGDHTGPSSAFRKIGQRPRFARIHCKQKDLSGLRLSVFLSSPDKREQLAIGRPLRRRIVRTRGQLPRSATAKRNDPQRSLIALVLLVDHDVRIDDARSIRRNARARDPLERINVGLGDRPEVGGN